MHTHELSEKWSNKFDTKRSLSSFLYINFEYKFEHKMKLLKENTILDYMMHLIGRETTFIQFQVEF